jgi:uncharacterized protein (TIGR02246 family)
MHNVDARVSRALAASEIRDLKMTYAQLCDAGYDGRALAELFTEDAVWDGGDAFGRHTGREAIEAFFSGFDGVFTWALHYLIGPRMVHVSDDATRAEAVWYLWMPHVAQREDGGKAMLLTAKQHDRYRYANGRWRFEEIRVAVETMASMEQGWAPTGADEPIDRVQA